MLVILPDHRACYLAINGSTYSLALSPSHRRNDVSGVLLLPSHQCCYLVEGNDIYPRTKLPELGRDGFIWFVRKLIELYGTGSKIKSQKWPKISGGGNKADNWDIVIVEREREREREREPDRPDTFTQPPIGWSLQRQQQKQSGTLAVCKRLYRVEVLHRAYAKRTYRLFLLEILLSCNKN
ncbi:hypothetical protein J6590_046043 [Homalodisca vitripennis]|nr:hypothetical protein J6590_046043 [Homalodisca vitripennis]